MTDHLGIVTDFRKVHVAVIGDVMLDNYVEGIVERVSPEAPCLILVEQETYSKAGGSGNACMNITALGAKCSAFGAVGPDDNGRNVSLLLSNAGCDVSGIQPISPRTNTKTRFMTAGHHLLRYDSDRNAMPVMSTAIVAGVLDSLVKAIESGRFHSVLISDYDKGLLSEESISRIVKTCRSASVPVIADPKYRNFMHYVGVDVLKCNLKEAATALGRNPLDVVTEDAVIKLCEDVKSAIGCQTVIITRGKNGMTISSGGVVKHLPARQVAISELSGAGDTVAAVIAITSGLGLQIMRAAYIANVAASLVVGKSGTASVTPTELAAALARDN